MISERLLFALRVSVSLTIATGLSLWLGWYRPQWAMFAVIYCALGTPGESLHKGMMRIGATFLGGAVSLLFTGMFNDDRWAFGSAVMLWVAFCAHKMQGNRAYYFWLVSGWLPILLPIYSSENPALAFEVVMVRLQQTFLGVGVYTLVAGLVFTDTARSDFIKDVREQMTALRDALSQLAPAFAGERDTPSTEEAFDLKREMTELHTNFRNRIDAGIVENFEVMENRDAWHRMIDELEVTWQALNRFRLVIKDVPPDAAGVPMSEIAPVADEITRRLNATIEILDGTLDKAPEPEEVQLPKLAPAKPDENLLAHGAILLGLKTLQEIETHSRHMLIIAAEARGLTGRKMTDLPEQSSIPQSIIPDPEHIARVLRTAFVFMLAFLIYIYCPELPGGPEPILLSTIICMFVGIRPTMPVKPVSMLGTLVLIVGGIINFVLMPKLSSYLGLGTVIFIYSFAVSWLLYAPGQQAVRFITLGFVALMMHISNVQQYDFNYVANLIVVFQIPFMLLWFTNIVPVSFQPEDVFQRLLRRYLRSFTHLVEDLRYANRTDKPGWWRRQLRAYHLRNIVRIPGVLDDWLGVMPEAAMNEDEKEAAQALNRALLDLSSRTADLMKLREVRFSPETVAQMRPAINAWREGAEQLVRTLEERPEETPPADTLRTQLDEMLTRVQRDAEIAINAMPPAQRGEDAAGNSLLSASLLKELSAFRGMSEALIRAARQIRLLDWARIREARF